MRVHGVILEPLHLRALVDLHAVVDEQVLESLQAGERIDAVGAAVANAGAEPLRAEDAFQLLLVVGLLIGETDFLPAMQLGIHGFLAAFAEPQKQRVLLDQAALDVVFLDGRDQALDAAQGRVPDLARGLDAVAAHQLVQLELAVGREEARAASRGTAADDVLVEQHDLVAALQELDGGGDAGESAADDRHVTLDVPGQRRAVPMLIDEQRRDPPVLIDQPRFLRQGAPSVLID